ncbi:MAG: Ferredoxin--NADP reductase [Phycisphaerae bacterium]|nr:Ferredoxin--NADP reductase [Phycisphaerae bacterium]
MTDTRCQVAVIGAGPIGLELAVALKHAGVDYIQFDAGQIGSTVDGFPRQMRFFSSPQRLALAGVPIQTVDQGKCTREEYLAYLRALVQQFDLPVRTYERVAAIARDGDGFVLTSRPLGDDGQPRITRAARVVIATGDTTRPRRLGIPGEDLPHVSHRFDEPHRYFRRRLLVVGGRNSAAEAALRCHHAGARVAVSYRRDRFPDSVKYWLLPEINMLIDSGRIEAHFNTQPVAIAPGSVTLARTGGAVEVAADFVLVLIGFEADMTLCEQAGVELAGQERAPRYDERTMMTNVPGLYVAGTVAAGEQTKYNVFLENCHVHVARIVADLTGGPAPPPAARYARPES